MWSLLTPFFVALACTPPALDTAESRPSVQDSAADSGAPPVDSDDTDDDTAPPAIDADGDGYAAEPEGDDCDDTDPAVNPGATEIWYDGVDSDCSGGSDYDADGDGSDAEAWGGSDCDDTDASIQDDCPDQGSLLDDYRLATGLETVPEIGQNLSGIAWNPVTGTHMAVLDSLRTLVELDEDMEVLREIAISDIDHRDTEDIAYLGQDDHGDATYAIVTEDGVLYVGAVPDDGSTSLDTSSWQVITYAADDMGNSGGEGVAWDPATGTFWVCKEKNPMAVWTFARPTTDIDVSYEDGSLAVTEAFDAEALLAEHAGDLASCMFDPRTGRLLILSQQSEVALDVDLDGTLVGSMSVTGSGLLKPEGLTLIDDGDLVVVGEPNQWARYDYGGRGSP